MKDDITTSRMELDIVCDMIHSVPVGDPDLTHRKLTCHLKDDITTSRMELDIVCDMIHSVL